MTRPHPADLAAVQAEVAARHRPTIALLQAVLKPILEKTK